MIKFFEIWGYLGNLLCEFFIKILDSLFKVFPHFCLFKRHLIQNMLNDFLSGHLVIRLGKGRQNFFFKLRGVFKWDWILLCGLLYLDWIFLLESLIWRSLDISCFHRLYSKLRLPFWLRRVLLLLRAVWLSVLTHFSQRRPSTTYQRSMSDSIRRLNRSIC